MSWVTGIDWSSVVPASVVTSTAVTLLLRYFDRNRPNLVLTRREVVLPEHLSGNRDLYGEPLTLENIGTAPAIDVRFVGSGCVVAVELKPSHGNDLRHWESSVPSITPGESVVLQMHHSDADPIIVSRMTVSPRFLGSAGGKSVSDGMWDVSPVRICGRPVAIRRFGFPLAAADWPAGTVRTSESH